MSVDVNAMPRLGFGLMRLPEKDGGIDLEEFSRMADACMAAGMNYFDTAYVYHGGRSEAAAKEAIVKRYPRQSFYLATKLPAWCIQSREDMDRIFDEQLARAGVEYFDFYLLHSLEDGGNYDTYEKYDCFSWAMRKKAEGRIRHFGFSYHGSPELLERVLDAHPETEFVQIQLNYADWNNPVVRSGSLYEILRHRGVPMIVMEPVKGGMLANLPAELEAKYRAVRPDASAASWALRFAASLPGVMTVLSGMTHTDQVENNIRTFTNFEPLSESENALIGDVTAILLDTPQIGCTACRYCCDGCPMKISIPDVFRAVNTVRLYHEQFRPKMFYGGLVAHSGKASACIGCGQCERICPQHLPVISLLKEAVELLEN